MSDSSQPSNPSNSKSGSADLPSRKFYVRSGEVSWMVLAIDADIAALRFVQNALSGSLISGKKRVNSNLQLLNVEEMKVLAQRLGPRIQISEAGFSRSEAGQFVTSVVIRRWHKQIAALEQMFRAMG